MVVSRQLFLLQMDDLIGNVNDNHIPRNDTGGCSSIAFKNPQAVRPAVPYYITSSN